MPDPELLANWQLHTAMTELFPLIISFNLTRDSGRILCDRLDDSDTQLAAAETVDELIGGCMRFMHPDHIQEIYALYSRQAQIAAFLRGEHVLTREYRRYCADGKLHWISGSAVLMRDGEQGDICSLFLAQIIDDRKEQEQVSSQLLDITLKSSYLLVCLINAASGQYHVIIQDSTVFPHLPQEGDYNDAFASIWDQYCAQEEQYARPPDDGIMDRPPVFDQLLHELDSTNGYYYFRCRMMVYDGPLWVCGHISYFDSTRKELLFSLRNVHRQVVAELELQAEREQRILEKYEHMRLEGEEKNSLINSLMNSIPNGSCEMMMTPELNLLHVNSHFCQLFGLPYSGCECLSGKSFLRLVHPQDAPDLSRSLFAAPRDVPWQEMFRILRADGQSCWVSMCGSFRASIRGQVLTCLLNDATAAKEIADRLASTEQQIELVLAQTNNVIFEYDLETRTLYDRHGMQDKLAVMMTIENMPEQLVDIGAVHEEDVHRYLEAFRRIQAGEASACCEVRMYSHKLDRYIWLRIVMNNQYDADGRPVKAIVFVEDLDEVKSKERALALEEHYRAAMMADAIAFYEVNLTRNRIECAGGRWQERISQFQATMGGPDGQYDSAIRMVSELLVLPEYRELYLSKLLCRNLLTMFAAGENDVRFEHQRWLDEKMKEAIWVQTTVHMFRDESGSVLSMIYHKDITNQKREVVALEYRSQRDPLTGLYNRTAGEALITQKLQANKPGLHAFMILDLDYFKDVNDTYGHLFGDKLLRDVSENISSLLRSDDVAMRLGGDEYVIFMSGFGNMSQIARKADQILQSIRQIGMAYELQMPFTVSMGIAVVPQDGMDYQSLYEHSDQALYYIKDNSKNGYAFYDPQYIRHK